jgi:hypothetical protein
VRFGSITTWMSSAACGACPAVNSSSIALPVSNDVNATGTVGTNGWSFSSSMLPLRTAVRPGLPSLKMITPVAPAACALSTFTPKLQPPR